jgi:hypothetical protein
MNRKQALISEKAKLYLPFLVIGFLLGTLINPFIHELGHYSTAYLFNRSAIKEFHYSPENALKSIFGMVNEPYSQYVSYSNSIYEVFTLPQAFIVSLAGVVFTTVLFFLLVDFTKMVEQRYQKEHSKMDFILLSVMTGYMTTFLGVHFGWIRDGAMAMRIFTDNTLVMAIVITVISLALIIYTIKVVADIIKVLFPEIAPVYSPILRKLKIIK